MSGAKAECEALMNSVLPFAKQMLGRHGEFYSYCGAMRANGEIVSVAGYEGQEHQTWTKTNMTRAGGWCAHGKPLVDRVPHGHRHIMTFVAALRCDGIHAPCVLDQPINGISFLAGYSKAWCRCCVVATSS